MARIRVRDGKGGKSYQVIYTDTRTGKERCKTFVLRKAASDFLQTVGAGFQIHDRDTITVTEAVDRWLDVCEKVGRKGREPVEAITLRHYKFEGALIKKELGGIRLNKLTPARCQEFAELLLERYDRRYARRFLTSLKGVISQAITDERLISNPAVNVSIRVTSRHEKSRSITIPSLDHVRLILKTADDLSGDKNKQIVKTWERYRPFIYVLAFSGMRPGELLGLPWRNVDFKAESIEVTQDMNEDGTIGLPKSAAGYRTIDMSSDVMRILLEWKGRCPKSAHDLVFPNLSGNSEFLGNVTRRCWYVLQRKAGLVDDEGKPLYDMYSMRHVRASIEIAENATPKEIMTMMGHSSIKITFDVYGHLFPDHAGERSKRANRVAAALIPEKTGQKPGDKKQ